MNHHNSKHSKAFTIVELLVVIVVIGILATITLITYRGISQKAIDASVISDLDNTSKRLKLFQIENSNYPADISKLTSCPTPVAGSLCVKTSPGNTFGIFYVDNTTSPQTFCLTIKNGSATVKNINNDGIITDGSCTYPFASTLLATVASRSQINLSWGAIAGAQSYTLQRATNNTFTTGLTTLTAPAPTDVSAISSGLSALTTYYYRISVTINGDTSSWSNVANTTTLDFPAPANLAVTAKTTNSISLSWSAVANTVNYILQRSSTSDFAIHTDATIATGTTNYTSSGLVSGTYYYRVNTSDADGPSSWSPTLTVPLTVQNYNVAGSYTWTVPAGVSSVSIEVWGAQGSDVDGAGGKGGYAKGNLAVSPGGTLYARVGSQSEGGIGGSAATGCSGYDWVNPGGNGGGASDVRYGGNALANRKIVAGGGGGGGGASFYDCYGDGSLSDGSIGGEGGGNTGGGDASCYATQTSGNSLGEGQNASGAGLGGGGDGYWGGKGSCSASGGGSGYIGGVTGATTTIGNISIPAPGGGNETGHSGVGYIKIAY